MPTDRTLDLASPVIRHAEARVRVALADTRVVAIIGPRQSGKTTLARKLAKEEGRTFLTLDDEQTRAFAEDDPAGLLRGKDRVAIDEVQRAPNLILAIKKSVDEDTRPGRFLITGSADLFGGAIAPDSLAGRVETIPLLPLSQAEIGKLPPSSFLEDLFAGNLRDRAALTAPRDLVQIVVGGGFPEALARPPARRRDWLLAYAQSLAERDVTDIAPFIKPGQMRLLIDHAALSAGQLLNMTDLGARVGVDSKTIDRWIALLEKVFIVSRVRPWHGNGLKRLIKTPKLHFLDSGLLAALQGQDVQSLSRNRQAFGPLLECFVFSELRKATALGGDRILISHYRDKDQAEVDFILENGPGVVAGVEVKASATARPEDFAGLKRMRDSLGASFVAGVLLYDGDHSQQVGDRLWAAPMSSLWA
jgi:predicted AAA+ superfamily ATPase